MEIKYRWITYYLRKINEMLSRGIALHDPQLISTYCKYEENICEIFEMKESFEKETGEKVIFYKNFQPDDQKEGIMDMLFGTLKGFHFLNCTRP